MQPKTKKLMSLTVDGSKLHPNHTAKLYLSDSSPRSGGYSHPFIRITIPSDNAYMSDHVIIDIQAQRHIYKGDSLDRPAMHEMDTRQTWTTTYGATVELSHESKHLRVLAKPFRMRFDDQVAVALLKRINKAIEQFNLHYVEPHCELMRIANALTHLGFYVEFRYLNGGSLDEALHLHEVSGRGANRETKKAKEKQEQAEKDLKIILN